LGIGDWAQSPIPNPQSPFKNIIYIYVINLIKIFLFLVPFYLILIFKLEKKLT
jgi:hypothetical protein